MSRNDTPSCPLPGKIGAAHPALDRVSGPATFNEVFVQDGKVLGVPDTEKFADVRANGAPTGISYLMAAANLAAA